MQTPSPKPKLRIFLSYAVDDKPKVRKIYQRLKKDGFEPWLDEEQILPGHSRDYEIEKALKNSDVILLCFSMNSVSKEGSIQREYVMDPKNWTLPLGVELRTRKEVQNAEETQEF